MLMGENSHDVTWSIKNKIQSIQETRCPQAVKIQTVYDRTELIDQRHSHGPKELVRGRAAWWSRCCSSFWEICEPD